MQDRGKQRILGGWTQLICLESLDDAVDGAEIRQAPVEVGSLSHDLQSFMHPKWLALGFQPSGHVLF